MRKKHFSVLIAMLLCLSMFLAACGGSGNKETDTTTTDISKETSAPEGKEDTADTRDNSSSGEIKTGGTLKIGTGQTPTIIGYTPEITANANLQFLRMAFNSLVFYDDKGELKPELATSWETDPDAATITYHLRSGVKFSDGTDFNAEAVKWNIEQYQSVGRTEVGDVTSIECPDDATVVITLSAWRSSALESIGFFLYYMSPTAFEENGGADWARQNAVGTGPFILKEFNQGVSIKYTKNTNYWEEGKPYMDGVEFTMISEQATLENALNAGEIDLVSYAGVDMLNNLDIENKYIREVNQNGVGIESVGLIPSSDDENDPFYKAEVRQAMCYAIDADTIVAALGYGFLQRTNQWAAPGAITYNPNVEGYTYNPEKAKALLAEAGYADGFDTTLWAGQAQENWATAIADQLNQVGIRAKVELIDATKGNDFMANGWDGIYWHYASVSPDLGLYMGRHLDPSGAYYAKGIQHPQDTLDLLQNIRTAKDDTSKIDYEWQLQKLIYDEYALFGLPLNLNSINTIKYPYVQGDNWTYYHVATWTPADTWLDK